MARRDTGESATAVIELNVVTMWGVDDLFRRWVAGRDLRGEREERRKTLRAQ